MTASQNWPSVECAAWATLAGLRSVAASESGLTVNFIDGERVLLTAAQLWNEAPDRFDQNSGQSFPRAPAPAPRLVSAFAQNEILCLSFSDGAPLVFPFSRLAALARPAPADRAAALWPSTEELRCNPVEDAFEEAAAQRVQEALSVLEGPSGDESYGEDVSLRSHSVQAAMLASAEGMHPALVAAALLHDIGWPIDGRAHEITGAALARKCFGARVGDPIRLHVAAKRYLVALDPGYEATLSEISKNTLAMQGGPMNAEEIRAFEAEPGLNDALALRRIDDLAKTPNAWTLPLGAYSELLRRLALADLRLGGERA